MKFENMKRIPNPPAGFETYMPVEFPHGSNNSPSAASPSPVSPVSQALNPQLPPLLSLPGVYGDDFEQILASQRRKTSPQSSRGGSPGPNSPTILPYSQPRHDQSDPKQTSWRKFPVGLPPTSPTPAQKELRATSMSDKGKSSSLFITPPTTPGKTSSKSQLSTSGVIGSFKAPLSHSGSFKELYGLGMKISDTLPHVVQSVDRAIGENGESISAKIRIGDALEIVDGVFVTSKSIDEMKHIIAGPYGSVCILSFRSQSTSGLYTVRAKRHVPIMQAPQAPPPEPTHWPSIDADSTADGIITPVVGPVTAAAPPPPPSPTSGAERPASLADDSEESPTAPALSVAAATTVRELERGMLPPPSPSPPPSPPLPPLPPTILTTTLELDAAGAAPSAPAALASPAAPAAPAAADSTGPAAVGLAARRQLLRSIHEGMQLARGAGDMAAHRLLAGLDEQADGPAARPPPQRALGDRARWRFHRGVCGGGGLGGRLRD